MYSQQLGFNTSWKMLTRDKGWIKPILVLTLVGWIPILGQIAILGYGLEWARLTAWGVDAAPKQRGVAYGKVLSTGGVAFLIMVTMGIVLGIIDLLLFGGWYPIAAFPLGIASFASTFFDLASDGPLILALAVLVINLLMGTFTTAGMLRATIYDSFAAGWRVDRLFQMVGRDPGGFLHAYAVTVIGGLVSTAYALCVSLVGGLFAVGGIMSFALGVGMTGEEYIGSVIQGVGPGIVVLVVMLVVCVIFAGSVITTAMQLVSINAMGQWFCRFEVSRWGVSSAPLPDGVPRGVTGWHSGNATGMPQPPRDVEQPAGAEQSAPSRPEPQQPSQAAPNQGDFVPQTAPQDFSYRNVPAQQPVTPPQPQQQAPAAPAPEAAPVQPQPDSAPTTQLSANTAQQPEPSQEAQAAAAPIQLGPIGSTDASTSASPEPADAEPPADQPVVASEPNDQDSPIQRHE